VPSLELLLLGASAIRSSEWVGDANAPLCLDLISRARRGVHGVCSSVSDLSSSLGTSASFGYSLAVSFSHGCKSRKAQSTLAVHGARRRRHARQLPAGAWKGGTAVRRSAPRFPKGVHAAARPALSARLLFFPPPQPILSLLTHSSTHSTMTASEPPPLDIAARVRANPRPLRFARSQVRPLPPPWSLRAAQHVLQRRRVARPRDVQEARPVCRERRRSVASSRASMLPVNEPGPDTSSSPRSWPRCARIDGRRCVHRRPPMSSRQLTLR